MANIPGNNDIRLACAGGFKLDGIFKIRRLALKGGRDSCFADRDYRQMVLEYLQTIPQFRTSECLAKNIGDIAKSQIRDYAIQIACCA